MKYKAFISYRHSPQSRLHAERLESALRRYAKPLWKPPIAIFRDERVLRPGDDLPSRLREALLNSEFMLYLASKEAASSEWVVDELRIWCDELKRSENLILVHVSDRISVNREADCIVWDKTDAVPAILEKHLNYIPTWADLTWTKKDEHLDLGNAEYRSTINAIVARFRGIEPGAMNDTEVLTHRRNILVRNLGIAAIVISAILAFWFGIAANRNAKIAEDRRVEAEGQRKEAEQERDLATKATEQEEIARKNAVQQRAIAEDRSRKLAVANSAIQHSEERERQALADDLLAYSGPPRQIRTAGWKTAIDLGLRKGWHCLAARTQHGSEWKRFPSWHPVLSSSRRYWETIPFRSRTRLALKNPDCCHSTGNG